VIKELKEITPAGKATLKERPRYLRMMDAINQKIAAKLEKLGFKDKVLNLSFLKPP